MRARAGTNTGSLDLGVDIPVDEAKDVFAHYGLAVYVANVLEYSVVYALFALELAPKMIADPTSNTDAIYDKFFDDALELTFGNLIKRICAFERVSPQVAESLGFAKVVRNDLVHKFAKETAESFYSQQGREDLIAQCLTAVSLFEACHDDVEEVAKSQLESLGIDMALWTEKVESAMSRYIAEAPQT